MTALDPATWVPFSSAFGDGHKATRADSVTVTLRTATISRPAEILVMTVGYPLDADDAAWLASRLLEASEAIRGRALTFATLPSAVANDAVRAVEDAIDDNHARGHFDGCFTGSQGPSTIDALLDLGWRPMVTEREIGSAS